MKKTVLVLLALALVLTFVGCQKEVALGDKVGEWKAKKVLKENDEKNVLKIVADNADIDWWVITDMDGVVLQEGKDFEMLEGRKYREIVTKDQHTKLKSLKSDKSKWVLWIWQEDIAHDGKDDDGNKLTEGSRAFRGSFVINKNQGVELKAKNYKEAVPTVGTVVLKNNECGKGATVAGCKTGSWSGDYTITEIWPLAQKKDSAEWEAVSGKKYLNLNVKSGEEIEIIISTGPQTFAIKQPNRFTAQDKIDNKEKYDEQKNWYWCVKLAESPTASEVKALTPGGKINVNSGECKLKFDLTDNKVKAAYDVTFIKDEDIIWAPNEK